MLTISEAYDLPSLLTKKDIKLKSEIMLPSAGTFKRTGGYCICSAVAAGCY